MRGGPFNSPIMIGIANQYCRDARGPGSLHIQRRVAHVPDGWIGGAGRSAPAQDGSAPGRACRRPRRRRRSPGRKSGSSPDARPRAAGTRPPCWKPRLAATPTPASSTSGTPGIGADMVQVLLRQAVIEDVARVLPSVAEHDWKAFSQRDADAVAGILHGPQRMAEFGERRVQRGGYAGPAIDQGIVPVIQQHRRAVMAS